MFGGLFAGTEEAPGEVELFQGVRTSPYRGMGSIGAMAAGAADRYFQDSASNVDKLVPKVSRDASRTRGSVLAVIHQLMGGLRSSMGYLGCATIAEMHERAAFVEITQPVFANRMCMTYKSPRKLPTITLIDLCSQSCSRGAAQSSRPCSFKA